MKEKNPIPGIGGEADMNLIFCPVEKEEAEG